MSEWMQGVPFDWFDESALSDEEAALLLQTRAYVAQKCTGRAKKPVFLLPRHVVKGPWHLPDEAERINRELGRLALMEHWLCPEGFSQVALPKLFPHRGNQCVYLVTPALYEAPGDGTLEGLAMWDIATSSRSASRFGPRWLDVVARETVGVVRVTDRVQVDPDYLSANPGIWEHLMHRFLLKCGDSGLHNMLVHPACERPVGLDVDENRNVDNERDDEWLSLFFKSRPARRLVPLIEQSWVVHREVIGGIVRHLQQRVFDQRTGELIKMHQLDVSDLSERMARLVQLSGMES
jgi:hypothetical protein